MTAPKVVPATRRVLFAQRRLPHYRLPLLEALRERLAARGVVLDFIHGEALPEELAKRDEGSLSWAARMRSTRYGLGGRLCWQPFDTRGYELVIVSQENRLLFNHWLCRPWRRFGLAFFGHGGNLAAERPDSLRERFKRWTTRQADWWFAYTAHSQGLVAAAGFPADRITVLNNAVDTRELQRQAAEVSPEALAEFRTRHGLSAGATALFLGSMYAGKGLELLIEAAGRVHAQEPRFRLLLAGDGPQREQLLAALAGQPWAHWLGPVRGPAKALALRSADLLTLPGAVGLSIVDGLCLGLPLLTTTLRGHGPELAYLRHGENGLQVAPTVDAYADALLGLLRAPQQLAQLQAQARESGQALTVEAMAERFATGICSALERGRR